MSERYSKIFSLKENLYSKDSPVVIKAGALLKDNETSWLIAQLKLHSITEKVIKFVKVKITPLDSVNRPLDTPLFFEYLDLNVVRGNDFGTQAPIKISNTAARGFDAEISEVGFVDNSVWCNENQPKFYLPHQESISAILKDDFAQKGYGFKFGKSANYVAVEENDVWCCACGEINRKEETHCYRCNSALTDLKETDSETLKIEGMYGCALELLKSKDLKDLETARALLEKIKDKKDVSSLVEEYNRSIAKIQDNLNAKKSKKKKKITLISILAAAVIILPILGYFVGYPMIARATGNYKVYIDMYNISDFKVPKNAKEIKENAFYGCESLKSVTIPDGVEKIGDNAFLECSNLEKITIGTGVKSIGVNVFGDCPNLHSLYITDIAPWCNVTYETSQTYMSNPFCQVKNVYINDRLTTEIEIPHGVTSIIDDAFLGCYAFTCVKIPSSVATIGEGAFRNCWNLKEVTIEYGVREIKASAFGGCESLESITIPDSVITLGDYAFSGCENLENITIPNSVTAMGYAVLSHCTSLKSVVIGNSVTSIGKYAFSSCESLTSIVIPDSVTSIGSSAFSSCESLTSIVIPNSVTSIGEYAFCYFSLDDVYYTGSKEEWEAIDIGKSNSALTSATIHYNYVPKS